MVRNKLKIRFILLPLLYFLVWLRGTIAFCSYSWLYMAPALLILFALIYITLWCYRLERMLALSDVGGVYLNSVVKFKLQVAIITFVLFALVAELLPLIAYPFIFLIGMVVSVVGFSKSKRKDVFAIRELLLKEDASNIDISCYRILSGGIIAEHVSDSVQLINYELFNNSMNVNPATVSDSAQLINYELFNDSMSVNPATGLPMVGAGVDVGGNPYGVDLNHSHRDI